MKEERHVIWSNYGLDYEDWRDDLEADFPCLLYTSLELVDNSVLKDQERRQIAMRPAVERSYLRKEEQADLFAIMDEICLLYTST